MIELIITKNEEGSRLNKICLKYLNEAPSSFIYKMIRKKNIVLNDKKVQGDEILKIGDCIKFYLADDTINKFRNFKMVMARSNPNLDIIFENQDIIIVNKKAGVLSQKAKEDDYSINEMIIDYAINSNILTNKQLETFKPSICNRLDRNTSGIILAGLSLKGSTYLSDIIRNHAIQKYYFTIVSGDFDSIGLLDGYISKDEISNTSSIISVNEYKRLGSPKNYLYFKSEYYKLLYKNNLSYIKIRLITGKSHQIRAHLKYLGFPIIGDTKYGDYRTNKSFCDKYKLKYHLLHAGEIILPSGDKYIAQLPDTFNLILKDNFD